MMEKNKNLLVLVDGSARSLLTVDYVGKLEAFSDMRIVLFNVFSGVPECFWDLKHETIGSGTARQMQLWEDQRKRDINAYMDRARQHLINSGIPGASIETVIHNLQKGVARDILKAAESGYTAVVCRRREKDGLEGVAVGSVANKLIAKIDSLPVLVAGRQPQTNKVLLAVDGSASSVQAVDFVAEHMGGRGYKAGLFHVIRGFPGLNANPKELEMASEWGLAAEAEMQKTFEVLTDRLLDAGFSSGSVTHKIISGVHSRAEAIVQEAQSGGYGIIVVGRRGLSRVSEFFMGRVSTKVVQAGRNFSVWIIP
ncbi:MAG: universal stress protein [Desulfobacterales bacterium]|nr:universal stress protein [Desulfobacterales bacterium]